MNSLAIFGEITFSSISYLVNTVVISTWLVHCIIIFIHFFLFCITEFFLFPQTPSNL